MRPPPRAAAAQPIRAAKGHVVEWRCGWVPDLTPVARRSPAWVGQLVHSSAASPRCRSFDSCRSYDLLFEYAMGRRAVVALAQPREQIRHDQQSRWGCEQQAADDRTRQRSILFFTSAAD